jgi:phage/plasmid-associated DNA primase
MSKLVLAPQDHIELYEDTAREFFRDVLDLNYDECLVTDETHLSDFSSCGLPDDVPETEGGLKGLYAAWDKWVLAELKQRYDLDYATTAVPLLTVLHDVEAAKARRHH